MGWYYDDFDEQPLRDCGQLEADGTPIPQSGRKIAFTSTADPAAEAIIRFDCEPPVFSSDPGAIGKAAAGLPCPTPAKPRNEAACADDSQDTVCVTSCAQLSNAEANQLLYCVSRFQTCQLACNNNADCPGSWVCDFRQGDIADDLQGEQGYCVNPTCAVLRPGREDGGG